MVFDSTWIAAISYEIQRNPQAAAGESGGGEPLWHLHGDPVGNDHFRAVFNAAAGSLLLVLKTGDPWKKMDSD